MESLITEGYATMAIESLDHPEFDDVLLTANETLVDYINSGTMSKEAAWGYMGRLGLRHFSFLTELEIAERNLNERNSQLEQ